MARPRDTPEEPAAVKTTGERRRPFPGQSITSRDIAGLAGVSQSTVSRVVNGFEFVKPTTRARVLRAMAQLGYVPNAAARSLITHQTRLVGLLVSSIGTHAGTEVLNTISRQAGELGYAIVLSNLREHTDRQAELLNLLLEHRVDGVIAHVDLIGPSFPAQQLLATHSPLVLVNDTKHDGVFDSLSLDYEHAVRSVASHLLDHGRTRIAYIGGASEESSYGRRMAGFEAALQAAGLEQSQALVVIGASSRQFGYASVSRLLASDLTFDAVLAATDDVATGVLDALADHAIRVPDNVSVASVGDTPTASLQCVSLTSFTEELDRVATGALKLLLDRVEGRYEGEARNLLLQGRLAVRNSCGCRPGRLPSR